MSDQLFENVNFRGDPHADVKGFFNNVYEQGEFLWALKEIADRRGCGVNYDICMFPDFTDADVELHFKGVKFYSFDDEVVVSEDECKQYMKAACVEYLEKHPSEFVEIMGHCSKLDEWP
jgi:hypothetical protein